SRMRILASGQVLENIENYNRVHVMCQVFSATDNREHDDGEGFVNYWQMESTSKRLLTTNKSLTRTAPSSSMTVLFKPIAGILQVRKYLPLQFVPLTIELSLVDNATYPIIYPGVHPDIVPANSVNTKVTCNSWSILNVQAKCDLVTLDNRLEEEFI
ncbi:MAG: hypothetical protein ACKPKO_03910, partial [Candidatus Fonsibacter sp.]